ncbi:hypothetical protein GGI12_006035, partial [Dipsacomyces acuminosporus]
VKQAMQDLKVSDISSSLDGDSEKWDDGIGVKSEEVKELIERLKRIEKLAPVRAPTNAGLGSSMASAFTPVTQQTTAPEEKPSGPSIAERLAQAKTKQERDQILKDIAEERFRERQRALGVPEPEPNPEMQQKPAAVEANSGSTNPWDAPAASVSAPASNPFANQPTDASPSQPALGNSNPIFANSLEVDNLSDTSSEEWDHNSDASSDDEDNVVTKDMLEMSAKKANAAATPFGDQDYTRPGVESPKSNVSFDTAFANPAPPSTSTAEAKKANEKEASDVNNPFHGLIAAKSSPTGPAAADQKTATVSASVPASTDVAYEKLRLRALYPYSTDEADELDIEPGDLIETRPITADKQSTTEHADEGWMYGELLKESESDQGDGWEPSGKKG